jgi:hypothetical protein
MRDMFTYHHDAFVDGIHGLVSSNKDIHTLSHRMIL